jgi:S-DNA-T family DNA segregation ATPase FtsK/SpoIIIE
MNSELLNKINNFIKNRLIEFAGVLLMLISIFLLTSIITYSPGDPNFIYTPENTEIKNLGGFYGSVVSDFLLQSLGLISILLVFNFFYWGAKLTNQKKISFIINKVIFVFIYIIFGTTSLNILYND